MKVIITPRAKAQIDHQFAYGVARHGARTAQRTFARVDGYMTRFLADFPLAGRRIAATGLIESPIARTPFIVIYPVEQAPDILRVVGFFHGSQDRADFTPDDE